MAVSDAFRENWLECQEEYGKNIEQGDIPVLQIDAIDHTISLPAVKFRDAFDPSGDNVFDSYVHIPMQTFKSPIDRLAETVAQATADLNTVKSATIAATEAANAATEAAENATEGAERVNAQLIGMTVTVTDRNGHATSQNIGFEIYRVYPSVAAMNADAANVPAGKFVMIATTDTTSEENARLYGKNSAGTFTFLSDLDQASSSAWADWMENYKPVIESDHTRAETDHSTATSDHTTAVSDHSTAVSDHSTATTDHTTATADHTQAESDHTRAESEHTRAESDHTRAETDHTTAATDHQTATDDHQTAVIDHGTADADHTNALEDTSRAADDHDRAESDHTRAETDHSTATSDHEISASQQAAFEANEAQRQRDFENAEEDRIAAMTVTRAFVDTAIMCLTFIQPKSDSTSYRVVNGCLNITTRYVA